LDKDRGDVECFSFDSSIRIIPFLFIKNSGKKNDYLRSLVNGELLLKNSSVLIYFLVIEPSSGHGVEGDST
jgi:hypothetical protein